MKFSDFIDSKKRSELDLIAEKRIKQQDLDNKNGNFRASFRYGKKNNLQERDEYRLYDHKIGVYSEYIISLLVGINYNPTFRQYVTGSPDLIVSYDGKEYPCEVRGSRYRNYVIFRERDYEKNDKTILCVICGFPKDEFKDCELSAHYSSFKTLKKLKKISKTNKHGSYELIGVDKFLNDFSKFKIC